MRPEVTAPNEVSPEDYNHMLTVGRLLDFIEKFNIPRDAKVFYQRIEDSYFIGNDPGWRVVKKEGEFYHMALKINADIDSGKYFDKDNYPDAKPELMKKFSEQDLLDFREEYIVAFSPVKYKDDNNLYIDAHY